VRESFIVIAYARGRRLSRRETQSVDMHIIEVKVTVQLRFTCGVNRAHVRKSERREETFLSNGKTRFYITAFNADCRGRNAKDRRGKLSGNLDESHRDSFLLPRSARARDRRLIDRLAIAADDIPRER